jgi:hypothetical protein
MKYRSTFLVAFLVIISFEFLSGTPYINNKIQIFTRNNADFATVIRESNRYASNSIDTSFPQIMDDSTKSKIIKDTSDLKNKEILLTTPQAVDSVNYLTDKDQMPKWHTMITKIPSDLLTFTRDYITTDNLPMMIALTVSTAGLIISDDATWKESDRFYKRSSFNKSFSDYFTEFGDGRTQFILAGGFAAYGLLGKDNRALRTASQIVEVVLGCGFTVQVLKHITGRESPFVATAPGGIWRFFPNQIDYHKRVPHYDAYPSGHIATSMATFIVIARNFPEYKWIEPTGWVLAGLIGFGMANTGIHWYSDYPLGLALGYAFGELISEPENTRNEKQSKNILNKLKVFPSFSFGGAGVNIYLEF